MLQEAQRHAGLIQRQGSPPRPIKQLRDPGGHGPVIQGHLVGGLRQCEGEGQPVHPGDVAGEECFPVQRAAGAALGVDAALAEIEHAVVHPNLLDQPSAIFLQADGEIAVRVPQRITAREAGRAIQVQHGVIRGGAREFEPYVRQRRGHGDRPVISVFHATGEVRASRLVLQNEHGGVTVVCAVQQEIAGGDLRGKVDHFVADLPGQDGRGQQQSKQQCMDAFHRDSSLLQN